MTPITTDIADLVSQLDRRIKSKAAWMTSDQRAFYTDLRTALETAQAEIDQMNEHLVEVEMRAHKWMEAHDKLKAGRPYKYPSPADVPTANRRIEELEAEAQFLCDRLRDLESDILDDEVGRQYYGHVSPARARLEDLLQPKEQQP